jgi:septal ring factor EnvC (AmiA/AmiB activator)
VRTDRVLVAMAVVVLLGACALGRRPSLELLGRADHLLEQGQHAEAVVLYEEWLGKYPNDPEAPRAIAARDTATHLLSARADVARVRDALVAREDEVGRLRQELAARESELGRLKQELQRLLAEAESLRAALEELKRIDLKQERKRR